MTATPHVDPVDPVTTEVVGSALLAITDEMSAALVRTAYSPNVKERVDCSTALFGAGGRVLAQSQRLPLHMGSLLGSVRHIVERFPRATLRPGDMFLANDPYHGGGSHLPDFNLVAPIFVHGELVAFAATTAHHSDVGGMVPGSESADCREIYQEGIRIPPVRLCAEGEVRDDIMAIVALNSRTPHDREGDLRAQIAANHVGTARIAELCERYGSDTVAAHFDALLDATERRIRTRLGELTPGEYVHEERLDPLPDGTDVTIRVRLRVGDGALEFDFEGTSRQIEYARNVPYFALAATACCVVKTLLDPEIAANDGFYRTVALTAPAGCLVNPEAPAAVGARALSCGVLADALAGVLSQAVPVERAVAGSAPHQLVVFAGVDPRNDEYFVNYETIAGALGARPTHDGIDGVRIYASGAANLPIEALEQAFPLRVERYELRDGSGGTGLFRGGQGIRRDYRMLAPTVEVSLTGERHQVPAAGLSGGSDGGRGEFVLNPGTEHERRLTNVERGLRLVEGDVLRVDTPGGGGFGATTGGAADA